jgi:hypothetical protein
VSRCGSREESYRTALIEERNEIVNSLKFASSGKKIAFETFFDPLLKVKSDDLGMPLLPPQKVCRLKVQISLCEPVGRYP